jgi:hypothetical protein
LERSTARALRNRHREDAVFKRRTHCTVIDVECEWYLTLEASVEPFAIGPIAVLGLHLLLTPYGQNAVLEEYFNVALLEAGQLRGDAIECTSRLSRG